MACGLDKLELLWVEGWLSVAVFIYRPTYLLYHLLECCLCCQLVIWARFRQQGALAAVFGFLLTWVLVNDSHLELAVQ